MAGVILDFLAVFSRWVHVMTACAVIGGLIFMRFIVPRGLGPLGEGDRRDAMLRMRRAFKILVHSAIVLFIASGTYNAYLAWDKYPRGSGHAMFGVHVVLALMIFAIAIWLFLGEVVTAKHRRWMLINLLLLGCAVAAASSLKFLRERAMIRSAPPAVIATQNLTTP